MDNYDMFDDTGEFATSMRRRSVACRCFAPGECAGSCPGPDNCPMCDDPTDDSTNEEEN